jgi:octanoyl-[GcvH]:protein N-octanoyltransferase
MQGNAHNPRLRLIRASFPDLPAYGTAVSEAIMRRVAAGHLPATLRLHRPARELAFSKQDAASAGFGPAVRAARRVGFEPVVRLAGGRAAAFHEGTLAIAWSRPEASPLAGTRARFEELAGIVVAALARLGVDARVGAVAGEYCPGAWSVNARGRVKLAGIGQRLIAGAAHLGGVLVVSDGALLRSALEPVYAALGLEWDPATAAAVEDEASGVSLADAEEALLAELGARYELSDAELDPDTLELAQRLESVHRPADP